MSQLRFLFPSDYFRHQQVDAAYVEQQQSLHTLDYPTSVICLENLGTGSAKIYPAPAPGEILIYRGWMLSPDDYSLLVAAVNAMAATMWITQAEYLATHYLPNWYPLISDLTPETYCFEVDDDLEAQLSRLEDVWKV